MVVDARIAELVLHREYGRLRKYAQEYLKTSDWPSLLKDIGQADSRGRGRDAVVSLLELEAVGGTDSYLFKKFSDLEGSSLQQVQANAVERVIDILKEQIENRHTYFLDLEAMVETPYIIMAKEILDARQSELAELGNSPSRIDVLGTFYGFMILMADGSRPCVDSTGQQGRYRYRYWGRRTWLDEKITDSAADAVRAITREFAEEVEMDKSYLTLGSSRVFKSRCTPITARILANAVRIALYKAPGNRGAAAAALGATEDSRSLPFLHHTLGVEKNRRVRMRIVKALGKVGHDDSLALLRDNVEFSRRSITKYNRAIISSIGGIYSKKAEEVLIDIIEKGGNTMKAAAIRALGSQARNGLLERIAPFLTHRSRPVVRAAVLVVTDLGCTGNKAINENLSVILKRIGNDKSSQNAVVKVLRIPGVGQDAFVQRFFAKRIDKLREDLERYEERMKSSSYTWYLGRRIARTQSSLRTVLRMAGEYLEPLFEPDLLRSVKKVIDALPHWDKGALGQGRLIAAAAEESW